MWSYEDMVGELISFGWHTAKALLKVLLEPLAWPVQQVRDVVAGEPMFAVLLLAVLLGCALLAVSGDRLAALALVPLSLAWVVFNGPLEGPTLLALSWSHGVTVADVISVVGLAIAAWRLAPVLLRR